MNRRNSRSALFLMELILAILFFATASAVCVQLFVRAHLVSRDTQDLNQAMASAQSAAAVLQAENGDFSAAGALLEMTASEDGTLQAGYDEEWFPAAAEDAAYLLEMAAEGDGMTRICVTRVQDGEVLIELPVYCHTPLILG